MNIPFLSWQQVTFRPTAAPVFSLAVVLAHLSCCGCGGKEENLLLGKLGPQTVKIELEGGERVADFVAISSQSSWMHEETSELGKAAISSLSLCPLEELRPGARQAEDVWPYLQQ